MGAGAVAVMALAVALTSVPARGHAARHPGPELVLREFARVDADTPTGRVSVLAGEGLARTYEWGGCSLSASMSARRSRWYGSLGAYDAAGRAGLIDTLRDRMRACKGISRPVVQEGQIHFADVPSAERWLRQYARMASTVWNDRGIVLQWQVRPSRDQLNVDLWLMCINGDAPVKLAGATNDVIGLHHRDGAAHAIHTCARVDPDVIRHTQKMWEDLWRGGGPSHE